MSMHGWEGFLPENSIVMTRRRVASQQSMPEIIHPQPGSTAAVDTSSGITSDSLARLSNDLQDCTRCKLCERRTTVVVGEGNPRAELMFIGEGPGEEEDLQGRPFVGKAGQLLDKMIEAMGLTRENVYVANVVKCLPPDSRDPRPEEIKS